MKHLKWGILGTGRIANRFAQGLNSTDQATALAVGSRTLEKAREFAEKHKFPRAYGSYDELLADREVDAVYIPLPNHLHGEWTIKCAQAGKHILCEKPAMVNTAELEKVLSVVKRQDVFFMEAFMYRCHPQWQKVKEIIATGAIGEVRVMHSAFSFNMGPRYDDFRLSGALAGGGLMDVGVYCVSAFRLIAGEEPLACRALGKIGERSGVDEWAAGVLQFPSGMIGYFTTGIECSVPSSAVIYGSEGSIAVASPWVPPDGKASLTVTTGKGAETVEVHFGVDLYAAEALAVAEHLDQREAPAMNWEDSLGQARAIDALRASMGLVWDFEKGK
jgi:predicted dehydrogenase